MSKKKFTFGLRTAANANMEALIDFDQVNGGEFADWNPVGTVCTGKENHELFGGPRWNNKAEKIRILWREADGSITEIAPKWSLFKRRLRVELEEVRGLTDAVRERAIGRRVMVLRVAVVVGAVVYGAATNDIKGAVGIVKIGNQLANALEDGNLSVAEIGALVQGAGEQFGVDFEAEIRNAMTEAGVSEEDQEELIGPWLDDMNEAKERLEGGGSLVAAPPLAAGVTPGGILTGSQRVDRLLGGAVPSQSVLITDTSGGGTSGSSGTSDDSSQAGGDQGDDEPSSSWVPAAAFAGVGLAVAVAVGLLL